MRVINIDSASSTTIAVPTETRYGDARVALVPEDVRHLVGMGHKVIIETGAGQKSGFSDGAYSAAGGIIATTKAALYSEADIALFIKRPEQGLEGFGHLPSGALVAGFCDPRALENPLPRYADMIDTWGNRLTVISLELLPNTAATQEFNTFNAMGVLAGKIAFMNAWNDINTPPP